MASWVGQDSSFTSSFQCIVLCGSSASIMRMGMCGEDVHLLFVFHVQCEMCTPQSTETPLIERSALIIRDLEARESTYASSVWTLYTVGYRLVYECIHFSCLDPNGPVILSIFILLLPRASQKTSWMFEPSLINMYLQQKSPFINVAGCSRQ